MLIEIMVHLIIIGLAVFIGGVIGYITLGKETRFHAHQVLDEIEDYKQGKENEDNNDTFFNCD